MTLPESHVVPLTPYLDKKLRKNVQHMGTDRLLESSFGLDLNSLVSK